MDENTPMWKMWGYRESPIDTRASTGTWPKRAVLQKLHYERLYEQRR